MQLSLINFRRLFLTLVLVLYSNNKPPRCSRTILCFLIILKMKFNLFFPTINISYINNSQECTNLKACNKTRIELAGDTSRHVTSSHRTFEGSIPNYYYKFSHFLFSIEPSLITCISILLLLFDLNISHICSLRLRWRLGR